jgi:hypothetical protein
MAIKNQYERPRVYVREEVACPGRNLVSGAFSRAVLVNRRCDYKVDVGDEDRGYPEEVISFAHSE